MGPRGEGKDKKGRDYRLVVLKASPLFAAVLWGVLRQHTRSGHTHAPPSSQWLPGQALSAWFVPPELVGGEDRLVNAWEDLSVADPEEAGGDGTRAFQAQHVDERLRDAEDFTAAFDDANTWHFAMVNDFHRNNAYKRALEKYVRPDSIVLDIGSGGTGLLAMLAARAGARKVYTCEENRVIASIAQETLERNGFVEGGVIEAIPKVSLDLTVGDGTDDEMGERATVLVSEIFATYLTSEGVLAAVRHASEHLLTPDAVVIPARAQLIAAVVESEEILHHNFVNSWDGFDLSALNSLRRCDYPFLINLAKYRYRLLTDKFVVLPLDFTAARGGDLPVFSHFTKSFMLPVSAAGTAHFVCMWFTMSLDEEDEIVIDTDPEHTAGNSERSHAWGQGCHAVNMRGADDVAQWEIQPGNSLLLTMALHEQDRWPTPLFDLRILS